MGVGNGCLNLISVGWDDALFLKFLVCLFGGQLLGGFDGEFGGALGRFSIYFDTDIILAAALFALIYDSLDLKAHFATVLLPPVD